MKDWTRTPTDWADDPSVHAVAEDLRIDAAQVVGHLLNVWSKLPVHARDGQLAATPDSLLEQWARWSGAGKRRGAFAAAFRQRVLEPDGLWVLWEDLNGTVLREKDADRLRAADRRRAHKEERERQIDLMLDKDAKSGGPSGGPSNGPSDATNERNERTAGTAGARARRTGNPVAFVPGHGNLPVKPFCAHCAGVLTDIPGSKRAQLWHTTQCPDFTPLQAATLQPAAS